jgi:hypothetical protein
VVRKSFVISTKEKKKSESEKKTTTTICNTGYDIDNIETQLNEKTQYLEKS